MLRVVLIVFFHYYLAALWIVEVLIWLIEGLLLSLPAKNQLNLKDALYLSLIMNLVSVGVGWFLPL